MSLAPFLILAFIVGKTTSATDCIADLSPAWLIGTGSGVTQTTLIPTTETLSRIRADESGEGSSKFIATFDFMYGSQSSPTSTGWAPTSGSGYSRKNALNVKDVDAASGYYL